MSNSSPQSCRDQFDVVVVGLGPVGATLANILGQRGLSVLILERDAESYPLPRAVHFDDECMRVFQGIGLAEEILPFTVPSKGMRYIDPEGRLLIESPVSQELTQHGWHHGYRFHQPELERVLVRGLDRWPNIHIRRRADVFALEQTSDEVRIGYEDLSSGRLKTIGAKYVVGCDGARSTVRRFIGSEMIDLGFHERWLVVDLMLKVPRPDLGEFSIQHCNPARSATYVCGVGDRRRWEIRLHENESTQAMTQPDSVWPLLSPWLKPHEAELERQAVYTFHSVIAERWRDQRLLLAGDAVHQTPPFLGQGMCAGIRDASNLGWKLDSVIRGTMPDDLLDSYQKERASHVREYIELAVTLGGVINTTATNPVLPDGIKQSNNSVRLNRKKPELGRGFAFGRSTLIGKQAPQPPTTDGRRLDDWVGPGFSLIAASNGQKTLTAEMAARLKQLNVFVVQDNSKALQEWLQGTGHAAVLVRPDRYVYGAADTNSELSALLNAAFAINDTTDISRTSHRGLPTGATHEADIVH